MKHLKNLNDEIKKPPSDPTTDKVRYKDVIADSLWYMPANENVGIKSNRLAFKVFDAADQIDLEEEEFELIKEACRINPRQYRSWAQGPTMEKIIQSEIEGGK